MQKMALEHSKVPIDTLEKQISDNMVETKQCNKKIEELGFKLQNEIGLFNTMLQSIEQQMAELAKMSNKNQVRSSTEENELSGKTVLQTVGQKIIKEPN